MRSLWRWLTKRCASCGQRLDSEKAIREQVSEINDRASRLAKSLGRWPQVQSCKRCHKIVFEGESGFVQSLLLIDIE
jgi:hypothetical protein